MLYPHPPAGEAPRPSCRPCHPPQLNSLVSGSRPVRGPPRPPSPVTVPHQPPSFIPSFSYFSLCCPFPAEQVTGLAQGHIRLIHSALRMCSWGSGDPTNREASMTWPSSHRQGHKPLEPATEGSLGFGGSELHKITIPHRGPLKQCCHSPGGQMSEAGRCRVGKERQRGRGPGPTLP